MKRATRLLLAFLLALTMLPGGFYSGVRASATDYQTGDIISFGSYPQTRVTDRQLLASLNILTPGADGTVNIGRNRYKRIYFMQYTPWQQSLHADASNSYQDDNGYLVNTVYWFRYEPIKWRVLSNTDGELFVLSEKILAARSYCPAYTGVTWETAQLRQWLNGDFYNTAFSSLQKPQIQTTAVANADNPWYGTDGGNDTTDKVFLLSYAEAVNPAYGFDPAYNAFDMARRAEGTDYAKSEGLYVSNEIYFLGKSHWWLRSPGDYPFFAGSVYYHGLLQENSGGVNTNFFGVRPALKLVTEIFAPKAGSGCVVDRDAGFIYGLEPGITQALFESDYVKVLDGFTLEYTPAAIGTGAVVNVALAEESTLIAEAYTLVIFGDTNGDSNINAIDADICSLVQNWMIEWDEYSDAAYLKAGDINADGRVDSVDADIITLYENWLVNIDQTTGLAM